MPNFQDADDYDPMSLGYGATYRLIEMGDHPEGGTYEQGDPYAGDWFELTLRAQSDGTDSAVTLCTYLKQGLIKIADDFPGDATYDGFYPELRAIAWSGPKDDKTAKTVARFSRAGQVAYS